MAPNTKFNKSVAIPDDATFDAGSLKGKSVIVTGGASGIGELIANTLAVRNVTVVVLDINPIVTENCKMFYCAQILISANTRWIRQHHLLQVRCLEVGGG